GLVSSRKRRVRYAVFDIESPVLSGLGDSRHDSAQFVAWRMAYPNPGNLGNHSNCVDRSAGGRTLCFAPHACDALGVAGINSGWVLCLLDRLEPTYLG